MIGGSQLYKGFTARDQIKPTSDQANAERLPVLALQNVVAGIVMLAAVPWVSSVVPFHFGACPDNKHLENFLGG